VFCSLLRHLHGQAEPVPEKPDPLTAGPPDQFFGLSQLSGVRQDGSCQIRGTGSAWALLQAGDYIPGWPVPLSRGFNAAGTMPGAGTGSEGLSCDGDKVRTRYGSGVRGVLVILGP
jgi:hypothetical protein